jgi:hypothetical protein
VRLHDKKFVEHIKGGLGQVVKKKKAKASKKSSADVLDTIETEETKPKKKKKQKKKAEEKPKPKAKETPKSNGAVKDTTHKLPSTAASKKIVCKEVGSPSVTRVDVHDIKGTSKQVYVDNIHSANPQTLQVIYWVICPDTRHVILRVTEDQYQETMKALGKNATHHLSVVDCAVVPTLTYGSWQVRDIKGDFPSPQQIAEQDKAFKSNPTMFHNPPVTVELYEAQKQLEEAEQQVATAEDPQEEDFIMMEDEDEEDMDFSDGDEEDAFDFSED